MNAFSSSFPSNSPSKPLDFNGPMPSLYQTWLEQQSGGAGLESTFGIPEVTQDNDLWQNAGGQRLIDRNNMGGWDWFWGGKTKDGEIINSGAMGLLGIAKSGFDTWSGLKQLDLAEDTLNFKKEAFSKQFGAQQKLTNDQLKWRHKAREDRLSGSGGQLVQV